MENVNKIDYNIKKWKGAQKIVKMGTNFKKMTNGKIKNDGY